VWKKSMRKTASTGKLPGYRAPAIHKAFRLLRKVAESGQRLNLTDLAIQLGYSKSSTHGIVHALLREDALVHGPDGHTLYLGPAVVELAFSSWNYIKMVESVQPMIDSLRDQIKETMVLGAMIRHRILIMAAAEAGDPLKISASPGTVLPLFAGAAGKVLNAAKTNESVIKLIRENGLPQHTSRSIVNEAAYLAELEQVRLKQYSVDHEEYLTGVSAVAVALHNLKGPPMAVWSVGLSSHMAPDKIEASIGLMTVAAEKLRDALDKTSGY
jgi:DNA-binding IclR family transcriptional regulator